MRFVFVCCECEAVGHWVCAVPPAFTGRGMRMMRRCTQMCAAVRMDVMSGRCVRVCVG